MIQLPVSDLAQFVATTTQSAANDRGVVHQLLVDLGVSSNTAHTVQVWTVPPLRILLILAIAFVITRLERRYAVRLVRSLRVVSPLLQPTPRAAARGETIAGVVSAIIRVVIWVIAGLAVLSQLGINLGPFVAGATIIGAALGFGAQTLVKDFLSGLLILAEDQYGVGDNIVVNATTGTVEGMTLRITRIRALDGVIWYVPNGDIRTVGNTSEGDSVALVEVVVPLGTDLEAAGRAAEQATRQMASEAAWADVIIGAPTFAGIAAVAADGAMLRVIVRTAPGENQRTARELRLRLLERLRRDGLAWVGASTPSPSSTPSTPSTPSAPSAPEATPSAPASRPTPRAAATPPAARPRRRRSHGDGGDSGGPPDAQDSGDGGSGR